MNWPTVTVAGIIAALLAAVIIAEIRNKRNGKHSCSCGGNCDACGMVCGSDNKNN